MKLKICLMGLLCLFLRVSAQNLNSPKGLQIGDKLPDLTINNIVNSQSKSITLSELKDKVILLDFWATWCSSCITAFPSDYAIQQKYPDKFQVLLVDTKSTRDKPEMIKAFLERRNPSYQLPSVVLDTILNKLFPHQSLPHCVLIKNNIVLGITDAGAITEKNIVDLIKDKPLTLFNKADIKYSSNKPLFQDGNGGNQQNIAFRSMLVGKVDNVLSRKGFLSAGHSKFSKIFIFNGRIFDFYGWAYPQFFNDFRDTRIIYLTSKAKNTLIDTIQREKIREALFTYESIFPPRSKEESLKILREDINRYFHLQIDSQRRDTLCYVLKLSAIKKLLPADTLLKPETNIDEHSGAAIYFTNLPISYLLNSLESQYDIPFVDETGFKQNISLTLPSNILSKKDLIESLKAQGLTLITENRKITYVVLSDNKSAYQ